MHAECRCDGYRRLVAPHWIFEIAAHWVLSHLLAGRPLTRVLDHFHIRELAISLSEGVVSMLGYEATHICDQMADLGWSCPKGARFRQNPPPVSGCDPRKNMSDSPQKAAYRPPEHNPSPSSDISLFSDGRYI